MGSIILGIFQMSLLVAICVSGGIPSAIPRKNLATDTYDLVGIPAPYHFHKFQELATGERLRVGGNGDFGYIPNSSEGEYRGKVTNADLNGVYFVNPKDGWVVGSNGSIFRTEDRGRTWIQQASGVKSDLLAISCVSEVRCWVTGNGGVILTTLNGTDWVQVNSGVKTNLLAVDFLDNKVGLAVGKDALILRTDDGGITWRKQLIMGGEETCNGRPFSSNSSDLNGVTILNSGTAWVAGFYGVAMYSKAAAVWEGKCINEAGPLVGIVSQDGKNVFAVGSDGRNLVSKNEGSTWKPQRED